MKWLLNTSTSYLDRFDRTEYAGKPLANGWISNITTHPDYTAENHGFVHPNYMSAGILFKDHALLASVIADSEIDPVLFRLWDGLYEKVIKAWTSAEGITVPIQGQDWWYNQLAANIEIHAATNLFRDNKDAAYLELEALESQARVQSSNGNGCFLEANGENCRIREFQTAKDMEHQAAARIAHTYLLHLYNGIGVEPSTEQEFFRNIEGVYSYPYGSSIVYRTDKILTSFSWRNCAMALTMPEKGLWTITALPASCFGTVSLKGVRENPYLSNERTILYVRDEKIISYEKGFAASARIPRGDDELFQDVAFVALPEGRTVYLEKFTAGADCIAEEMRTGLVGIRNEKYDELPEVAKGYKKLYINGKLADKFFGFYGNEPDRRVVWSKVGTVNLDDEIGYIMSGSDQVEYLNKHVYPKWKGVEDIMTLNLRKEPVEFKKGQSTDTFVLMTLPNSDTEDTEKAAACFSVLETGNEYTDVVVNDEYLVYNSRCYKDTAVTAVRRLTEPCAAGDRILLYEGFNRYEGFTRYENFNEQDQSTNGQCRGTISWKGKIAGRSCGWIRAAFAIEFEPEGAGDGKAAVLEADVSTDDRAILHNNSDKLLNLKITCLKTGCCMSAQIKPYEYMTVSI
jgi:hypothetical protein